tara:strand:- start:2432 stop:4558 length:2127 start_codon:yes stop_codon:yes gene_type:complete
MERLYFSKENFNIIYSILQKKINSTLNTDINSSPKFRKELINIVKAVFQQRNTFNIDSNTSDVDTSRYLSQKVINIAMNYFTDTVKKSSVSNSNINSLNRDLNTVPSQQLNHIDTRPTSTSTNYLNNNGISNTNDKFNELKNMREIGSGENIPKPIQFKENINVSNDDIANRYNELNNSRQAEYELASKTATSNPDNLNALQNSQQSQLNQQSQFQHPQQYRRFPENQQPIPNKNAGSIENDIQMKQLIEQQQFIQEQINKFKQGHSNDQNPNSSQQPTTPTFNPPPQKNIQYLSEDAKPLNSILENQFVSLTDGDNKIPEPIQLELSEMEPDTNIDFNNLMTDMTQDTDINDQFNVSKQFQVSSEMKDIVPDKPFDTKVNIVSQNKQNPTIELDIIKSSINNQSKQIIDTNTKLDKMVNIFEKQDLSKYYETILDIPRLIAEQKKQPLTIRTHNLIVSSRDRDLSNKDFDKYNFRIVFGAEGSSSMDGTKYTSSSMANPSVQQVLKNVISIKMKRVIIPKPRDENYIPEPYLFISVDEFSSNIISTKTFSNKLFCKVHFDKEFGFNNGRKYIYYKNDDDDYTMFYSSPLAKLDRITLKLLNSDGNSAKETFNDSDLSNVEQSEQAGLFKISDEFFSNTFPNDKIFNVTQNKKTIVTNINSANEFQTKDVINAQDTPNQVVNISNQLEYIFEIKTQEPDPIANIRPNI